MRTARLVLRRWRASDRDPFAVINADPEVMRYFPAPLDRTASDALAERIDGRFDALGYGLWALEVAESRDFIGFTGLNPMPEGVPGEGGVEVGWRLAAQAWGHGYATEAARAALTFGFDVAGLPETHSITAVANLASQRVMQRIGMTYADEFDHPKLASDSPLRRHVRYTITAPSPPH